MAGLRRVSIAAGHWLAAVARGVDLWGLALVLLALFVLAPLTRPGYPLTAAGFQPVWKLSALESCGPVAWLRAVGPAHAALLPYGVAGALHALGLEPADAIKVSHLLALALGGIAVYGALHRRWGQPAPLLAGAAYTFLPYRLAVTYVDGNLGEAWALAMLPLAGIWLWRLIERPTWGAGLAAVGASVALILCHPGLAGWSILLVGLLALVGGRWRTGLPVALVGLAFLGGLAALSSPTPDFHAQYPYLFQLFSASWNAAPSGAGWLNERPFQLGVVPLGLALLGALAARRRHSAWLLAGGVALAALWALGISAPFWRLTGLERTLEAPWQVLGFAGLGLCLLAGLAVREARPLASLSWLAGLITLLVVSVYGYLLPAWSEIVPPTRPLAVFGEGQIALADYRIAGELRPGSEVTVHALWQSLRPTEQDYTVFVQILDETQTIRAQQDVQPMAGESPTSTWYAGQLIIDSYTLRLDAAGPPEGYQVILGLYDWHTGQRLRTTVDDKAVLQPNLADQVRLAWPCLVEEGTTP